MDVKRKGAAFLMALLVAHSVNATSLLGTDMVDDIVDTLGDVGTILEGLADLVPSMIDVGVQFAILVFILTLIGAILGFITGLLSFSKIMQLIRGH